MNKHFRQRLLLVLLVALASFLILAVGANTTVVQHQRESLKTLAQVVTPATKVRGDADVHIVDLDGNSMRARDLRSHTVSGHSPRANTYDLIHIHGVPEVVYRFRVAGELMAITQRRQGLMTVAPGMVIAIGVIYWLVVFGVMSYLARVEVNLRRELQTLSTALQDLRAGKVGRPVLVTPNSRLFAVVRETQMLSETMASMQRHMRLRRARFTRLINYLPQGIMLLDKYRDVAVTNATFGDLLGVVVSDTEHPYVDDVKEYELVQCIETVLKTGVSERRQLTIAQTGRTVDVTVVPIRDKQTIAQVLVILYDISEQVRMKQLQQDFVVNVSHELKTPVTAISGFAETLLAGAKDDPAANTEFLTIIQSEAKRLTMLINDIMTLQREDAPEETVPVNVADIIHNTVVNLRKPAAKRDVQIVCTVPDDLVIKSSPGRLTQIIRNLVDNAVFYNQTSGSVHVVALPEDGQLRLTVTDTGIGIPAAEQERIFERFYRVDKARSRNNGGTGLGLAITADAVAALHGTIKLDSRVGAGTTVTVLVPMNEDKN